MSLTNVNKWHIKLKRPNKNIHKRRGKCFLAKKVSTFEKAPLFSAPWRELPWLLLTCISYLSCECTGATNACWKKEQIRRSGLKTYERSFFSSLCLFYIAPAFAAEILIRKIVRPSRRPQMSGTRGPRNNVSRQAPPIRRCSPIRVFFDAWKAPSSPSSRFLRISSRIHFEWVRAIQRGALLLFFIYFPAQ